MTTAIVDTTLNTYQEFLKSKKLIAKDAGFVMDRAIMDGWEL